MAELSYAWWKKNKAKTLLKEPLSAALKEYDKQEANRKKSGEAEHFDATVTALSIVDQAIDKTKSSCNPKLHQQTIGYLDELKVLVKGEKKQFADHQKRMITWHKNVKTAIGGMADAWKTVESDPSEKNFLAYGKAAEKANKILVLQDQPYPSVGSYFGILGGEVFKVTEMHREEAKAAAKVAKAAEGGDDKADKKLESMMKAMKDSLNNSIKNVKRMAGGG